MLENEKVHQNQNAMTQEGYRKLLQELENRRVVVREEIAERIKVALSFGDLSENSEYTEAKEAQGLNEDRILELEKILKNAYVIEENDISSNVVSLGSTVSICEGENQEVQVYTIVNSKEEDIFDGKISSDSPVGQALLGKKKGETVEVKAPMGQLKYTIVKIGR